jgi:hypothetical protein
MACYLLVHVASGGTEAGDKPLLGMMKAFYDAMRLRKLFPPAALYPLDTIKTRLQTATSGGGLGALLRSGGGKALYSGLAGNLAGVMPATAIFMGVYEPVKQARAAPLVAWRWRCSNCVAQAL